MPAQCISLAELERLLSAFQDPVEDQGDDSPYAQLLLLATQQQEAQFFTERVCQPGEVIVREEDSGDQMYWIRSGRAAVLKGPFSNPVILGFRNAGGIVGEMALLENRPRSATVVALDEVQLWGLSRAAFFRLLGDFPEVSQRILSVLSARLRQSDEERREGMLTEQRLHEMAVHDPLTGLFNRRYMVETLAREMARAQREASPLSLILLDIDRFKQLNDTFGHLGGDRVLQSLAALLLECIRQGDIACRFGGEEFVLVLPGVPLATALERAERVRARFADLRVPFEDTEIRATISLGAANFPQDGVSGEELIRCADMALYRAKERGRNRVERLG